MNKHSNDNCYCNLFEGDGMPEGAVCKPCFEDGCICSDEVNE